MSDRKPETGGPDLDRADFDRADLDRAEIAVEIGPDGKIRFEVAGVPGQGCEELERILLAALGSPVISREHTPAFYARRRTSLGRTLKAWLGKK